MDFFDRQDASRRSTRWLVGLFGIAFLAVAIATAFVIAAALGAVGFYNGVLSTAAGAGAAAPLTVVALAAAGALLLMMLASLYRTATLSRGGGQVATMLGGTRLSGDETEPAARRLVNVVEEMAIASGLPVPEIYVLEQEHGINAFAAGLTYGDAAIAVTRGCLEQLSRAELRGVIAHEFSHILNGDMRLNLRLMGLGFGILVLSLIGRWLLRGARFSRASRNRGGAIVLVGLGLMIVGSIGVLLSRLIKAAVSRQREVLADASAVEFTREPLALAGALKKIGGYTPFLTATETEEVSHMLFGRAGPAFRGLFATHPPLPERIRALDPSFQEGDYPAPLTPGVSATHDDAAPLAAALGPAGSFDEVTVAAAGTLRTDATAAALLRAIPESLHAAAHSTEDAPLLIVALACAGATAERAGQSSLVRSQLGERRAATCLAFGRELERTDRRVRLPLVEIAVPALKRRPAAQIEFLLELLRKLVAADARETLFEFALLRLLETYLLLPRQLGPGKRPGLAGAWLDTLAVLAAATRSEPSRAHAALAAGVALMPATLRPASTAQFDSLLARASLEALDLALPVLAEAPPAARRDVLAAVEATIRHDGRVDVAEAELLRVIGAALGCPIPPASAMG